MAHYIIIMILSFQTTVLIWPGCTLSTHPVLVCSRSISFIWLAYLKRKTSCISQFLEHCIHIYTHMHIHIHSCTKKDTHAYGRTLIHTRICIRRYKHVQLQTDRQAQVQTNTNTRTQRKNNAYTNTYTRTKKLP